MAEGLTPEFRADAVDAAFGAALDALRAGLNICPPVTGPFQSLISAVSGGPDSMCLAVLASAYAARHGLEHRAMIIDHGIRAEAAVEAARVRGRLCDMGIAAELLSVGAPAPRTGIQEWARLARYDLLLRAAQRDQAMLLLGHHRDDQAETVMMRLLRGSGLGGLAGMRALSFRQGVPLLRPMLGLGRRSIDSYCRAHGIDVETDPTNSDRRFERVRLRQWLAAASAPTARDLCRLSDAAACIDDALLAAFRRHGLLPVLQPGGYGFLPGESLAMPDLAVVRLLAHAIGQLTAAPHPPSRAALLRLATRLRDGSASTLGGTRFTAHRNGWLMTAEAGRRSLRMHVAAGETVIFAGTWRVTSPVAATIRRLGEPGSGTGAPWRECRGWAHLPPLARRGVPVLETLDGTLRYPHLFTEELSCRDTSEAVAEFLPCGLGKRNSMTAPNGLKQAAAGAIGPGAAGSV